MCLLCLYTTELNLEDTWSVPIYLICTYKCSLMSSMVPFLCRGRDLHVPAYVGFLVCECLIIFIEDWKSDLYLMQSCIMICSSVVYRSNRRAVILISKCTCYKLHWIYLLIFWMEDPRPGLSFHWCYGVWQWKPSRLWKWLWIWWSSRSAVVGYWISRILSIIPCKWFCTLFSFESWKAYMFNSLLILFFLQYITSLKTNPACNTIITGAFCSFIIGRQLGINLY